jgi:hypothetical protein
MKYQYKAVRVKQTAAGKWLIFFAAPAFEIDRWSGVPRKTQLGNHETTGFQRDLNQKRLKSLKEFYNDPSNTIQNPLLLATRKTAKGGVSFEPDPSSLSQTEAQIGTVTVEAEAIEQLSLLDLLKLVQEDLEARVPYLRDQTVPPSLVTALKLKAELITEDQVQGEQEDEEDVEATEAYAEEEDSEDEDSEDLSGDQEEIAQAVLEESHILEFWQDIAARVQILGEVKDYKEDHFLGFNKEHLYSFLRPVVVVDGQHRLWGAIETAKDTARQEPYLTEIEQAIAAGKDAATVQKDTLQKISRRLPASLLMADDPAEHVFQFVVVNQKATPIGRALLGTIVSTSLSNDELDRVATRLTNAGIPLEESRVVSYLSRHGGSPFFGLVERGLASDEKDMLPWTVLVSLVAIFRKLRGGRLYHGKNDYADKWRRDLLDGSPIISDWEQKGFKSAYEYWESADGPWRDIFVHFWIAVKRKLGSEDAADPNHWGKPRSSNLFNKVSLTILAADFYQYLTDTRTGLDSAAAIKDLVDDWLDGVRERYFARDWKLSGVKKDSVGIRKRWSKLWVEYRKDPQMLPQVGNFRQPEVG